MRIALVSHYYPPHVGGLEAVVRHQAEGLVALGHEVVVLASAVPEAAGVTDEGGVQVHRLGAWNPVEKAGVPFPFTNPFAFARAVRRVGRVDVVHAHDVQYPTSWMAGLWALLTRTPLVVHQHVAVIDHPRKVVGWVQHAVYAGPGRVVGKIAKRLVVINSRVEQMLRDLGVAQDKIVFLANGIDHDTFVPPSGDDERRELRAKHGLPQDAVLALFVARPVPKKGFPVLMAATSPAYVVVTAGGHAEKQDEHVIHLGPMPTTDIAELMRASDLFVLPSVAEGFPLTIQEAMASELAIVTTDDEGYAGYGLDRNLIRLIRPTPDDVRRALTEVAEDPELRVAMGTYAGEYARTHFSWQRHAEALVATYAELVRPAGRARGLRAALRRRRSRRR